MARVLVEVERAMKPDRVTLHVCRKAKAAMFAQVVLDDRSPRIGRFTPDPERQELKAFTVQVRAGLGNDQGRAIGAGRPGGETKPAAHVVTAFNRIIVREAEDNEPARRAGVELDGKG